MGQVGQACGPQHPLDVGTCRTQHPTTSLSRHAPPPPPRRAPRTSTPALQASCASSTATAERGISSPACSQPAWAISRTLRCSCAGEWRGLRAACPGCCTQEVTACMRVRQHAMGPERGQPALVLGARASVGGLGPGQPHGPHCWWPPGPHCWWPPGPHCWWPRGPHCWWPPGPGALQELLVREQGADGPLPAGQGTDDHRELRGEVLGGPWRHARCTSGRTPQPQPQPQPCIACGCCSPAAPAAAPG